MAQTAAAAAAAARVPANELAAVSAWLKRVFGPGHVPPFEVTRETVSHLLDLAALNKERDAQLTALGELLEVQAQELQHEAHRLGKQLDDAGIGVASLPEQLQTQSSALAQLACVLDVREPTYEALLQGVCAATRDAADAAEAEQQQERIQHKLKQSVQVEQTRHTDLVRIARELQDGRQACEAEVEGKAREVQYFREKATEYEASIADLEKQLKTNGLGVEHAEVCEQSDAVLQAEQQLKKQRVRLAAYMDLPPDITGAKLKIAEAEKTLAQLETELADGIETLQLGRERS